MPVALVGADVDGKPNFMTAAFVSVVNVKPPMVACGLSPSHRTCEGIAANKIFSICVPSSDQVEVVDWCGIVSGHKEDKSGVFTVFRDDAGGPPMIEQCAVCAECRLVQSTPYGADTLYVAEIVGVYAKDHCVVNGKVDWAKVSPLLFTFSEPAYWKLGDYAGKPWQAGSGYDPKKGSKPAKP